MEVVIVPLATAIDEFGACPSVLIIPTAWKEGHTGANYLWQTAYICKEIAEKSSLGPAYLENISSMCRGMEE